MKKITIIVLMFLFTLLLISCDKEKTEIKEEELMDGKPCVLSDTVTVDNTVTLTAEDLWMNGEECSNLKFEAGTIKLDDINENGTFISGEFSINTFEELVLTWNALIDSDSRLTFLVSVGNAESYGGFHIMGYWGENYKASLSGQEDALSRIYIDTLIAKEENIDRFKLKVFFKSSNTEVTSLRNISVTTKPINSERVIDLEILNEKEIDVSPRQQMSIPDIGSRICSPTSLSMLMNYYNHSESPTTVAGIVFDQGAQIYGNWTFNVSYAGGFNELISRVEYIDDLGTVLNYLNNDIPLALSIKTQSKDDLEGSLMAYSSGHLVVIVGMKLIDNEWYAIINDPAEYTDENVRREYKLSQLLDAWNGYAYVIKSN